MAVECRGRTDSFKNSLLEVQFSDYFIKLDFYWSIKF